jgi:hypothetical protein
MIDLVARQVAGVFAVAQDGHAISERLHFAKPMGDVNDLLMDGDLQEKMQVLQIVDQI